MVKVTFSLDETTVNELRRTAARLRKAQSHVVRDAVADYAARADRLSERERLHVLGVLDRLRDARPTRPAKEVHAENGVLGYGRMVTDENEIDPDIYNAAGQFVALQPGASFFDSVASFEMARGGRLDTVILGAYEVDQDGSVANWSTADAKRGGIGGAMDLLSGKGDLIIVMEHVDSKGRPKLR